jgi:two-component system, OmpR family, sensor histidine kinase KdpD
MPEGQASEVSPEHPSDGAQLARPSLPAASVKSASDPGSKAKSSSAVGYGAAIAAIALALPAALLLRPFFGAETVPLIFLMAVIGVAHRFGLGPSVAASVAAMLCYNFFFFQPLHTFTVTAPANIAALIFFLFAAIVVSDLTARIRAQAEAARTQAAIANALYSSSRNLAGKLTMDSLLSAAASQIAGSLKCEAVILLPAATGELKPVAAYPPDAILDAGGIGAARWALDNGREIGHGAKTLPGTRHLFLPLRTGGDNVGVIALGPGQRAELQLSTMERRLLDALMDQTAVGIERERLSAQMDEARMTAETERLRSALLTSLSHDLKTPLTSILGAANSLREYGHLFEPGARTELLKTIEDEAGRLSRFVTNLLDMTRLEAGALEPRREPADIAEIVGTAVQRAKTQLTGLEIRFDLAPDLPLAMVDVLLAEQIIANLLDNAAKYAPQGSVVAICATRHDGWVRINVIDEGPGIPSGQLPLIFDKFYRGSSDHRKAGTGLGLAICRGFAEAMGGTIRAANRTDRSGAEFTVELPLAAEGVPLQPEAAE